MKRQDILVAWFSAGGQTTRLAKTLAEVTGGELYEIIPVQKYTDADLNWNHRRSRSSMEMNDRTARPAIAGAVEDIERFTTVFVGFPIWWYEAPRIIQTFLESYDFSGKTVIPFATSGGSGMGKTDSILKSSCSADTKWIPGKKMNSGEQAAAVKRWVEGILG